jgi:hypothetical protein
MNRARKLETQLAASIATSMPGVNVYRQSEDSVWKLPGVIVSVRTTGTNYMVKHAGQFADEGELRCMVLVDEAAPAGSDTLETLLGNVISAVESATLLPGWQFVHIDRAGDEGENSNNARGESVLWSVIMI